MPKAIEIPLNKTIEEVFGKIPVVFTRKPAKMGEDFIFWVPRVYVKNDVIDPSATYEVYLRKVNPGEKAAANEQ